MGTHVDVECSCRIVQDHRQPFICEHGDPLFDQRHIDCLVDSTLATNAQLVALAIELPMLVVDPLGLECDHLLHACTHPLFLCAVHLRNGLQNHWVRQGFAVDMGQETAGLHEVHQVLIDCADLFSDVSKQVLPCGNRFGAANGQKTICSLLCPMPFLNTVRTDPKAF